MKKSLLAVLLIVNVKAMAIGTIKGNGVYKQEKRVIGTFTGLSSAGPMNVEIIYGNNSELEIEGDENILPYIETFVKNGSLKIKVKDLNIIKPKLTIRVKISMTKISSVSQSGSGEIAGNGNFTGDGNTSFSISGSGRIKLGFENFHSTDVSMSGSGSLELKGKINGDLSINQSGSGKINCEAAPCQNASVKISGSGNTHINVTEALNAQISGSGRVYYTGTAKTLDSHISGSGGIEKI